MKAIEVQRTEASGTEPVKWRVTCLRNVFEVCKNEKLARHPASITGLTAKVDEGSSLEVLEDRKSVV